MVTKRTDAVHQAMLAMLRTLDFGGRFTPPSLKGTVVFPGFSGGAEWGGQAYDPETHIFYINANEMPWILRLVPPSAMRRATKASAVYRRPVARIAIALIVKGKLAGVPRTR